MLSTESGALPTANNCISPVKVEIFASWQQTTTATGFSRCPCWLVERILWNNSRRGIFEFWILVSFKKIQFQVKGPVDPPRCFEGSRNYFRRKKKFFLKKKKSETKIRNGQWAVKPLAFYDKKKGKLLETGNGGTTRKLRKRADSGPSELCKQVTSLVLSPLKIIAKMNGIPEMFSFVI